MQLNFQKTYLSIIDFPSTTLPSFTLITGPNGAGKSHLLQAIHRGHITTDIAKANTPTQAIRLFDWSTLVPQDTGAFSSESLRQEKQNAQTNLRNWQQHNEAIEYFRAVARKFKLPTEYVTSPHSLARLSQEGLQNIRNGQDDHLLILSEIKDATKNADAWILNQSGDENVKAMLIGASAASNKPVALLEPKDLDSELINWGRSDLFQHSFARLFVAYRDAKLSNMLAELQSSKGHKNVTFLSDDEFLQRHGPPPWEFVNDTIQKAGLDFTINTPDSVAFSAYTPQLTKTSSGIVMPFSSLSSGEKILMSFAFCVYYANDRRQLAVYPKLILFDEIDAPLHPSMTKSLVDTITVTLVDKFGINVIATTHSPSTVALAPPESIHLMQPGKAGLLHVAKAEALNMLTTGVPTLAISYDGRRQVFVESPADAHTYDALYKIFKPRLPSDRSLEFIATGTRSHTGNEVNSGCEVVKRLVNELVSCGNQSVFGLIDYDGHHTQSNRIVVAGNGERDGLENFLLDPVLLAAVICRDSPKNKAKIGIRDAVTYPQLISTDAEGLQIYADTISELVFGKASATIQTRYFGGFSISINERWRTEDDHALEILVIQALPFLQSITKKQPGLLMQHIIATVIADAPHLAPASLVDTLRSLLDRESHL